MAQNIWADAFNNSLRKPGRRERHVKDGSDCLNKLGGEKLVAPLAYACFRGHLEVITLPKHGARPNVIRPHGHTALLFTLIQASPNQLLIIKALLVASDGVADPNEVYPAKGNALTLAIEELRDNRIVELLLPFNTPLSDLS
jgi:ankyrin repeat protein